MNFRIPEMENLELISFHLKKIAKHVVSVTISGVPKLLVLMLVLVALMFAAKLKVLD